MKNYLKITLPKNVQKVVSDNDTVWHGSRKINADYVERTPCLIFLAQENILFRPDGKNFYVFNYHWLTDYIDGAIVIELED